MSRACFQLKIIMCLCVFTAAAAAAKKKRAKNLNILKFN